MDQLDGHLENLAASSTNSHAALHQLVAATTEQYANIKAATPSKPSPRSTPKNTNPISPNEKRVMEKRILILQSAVKNKWKVGGVLIHTRSRRLLRPRQRQLR